MQILRNFFTPIVSKHKKQNFKEQKLLSLKKVSFFLLFNENFILFLTSMLLACYKPSGISSFDVVKIIRTHFQNKVWHSGTLDPMASGLMILGSGKGTKELTSLIRLDKSYETTIDFSLLTDTRDASFWEKEERFEVIKSQDAWTAFFLKREGKLIPAPSLDQISQLLDSILFQEEKEVLLPLPTFSAKKQNGKRLYKDARKGTAEIQEKPMKIYAYKILDYQFPLLKLRLKVGSGTYIRSIGYWLGQQLGLGGALIQLERTSTGKFQLSDIGTQNSAKGNIKGQERTIYFKEIARDTI